MSDLRQQAYSILSARAKMGAGSKKKTSTKKTTKKRVTKKASGVRAGKAPAKKAPKKKTATKKAPAKKKTTKGGVHAGVRAGAKKKKTGAKKTSPWIQYVKDWSRMNNVSYAQALMEAGPSYHAQA